MKAALFIRAKKRNLLQFYKKGKRRKDMSPFESLDLSAFSPDSEMLRAAVAAADGNLTVPPVNPRTGKPIYLIDEPILLPSDFTVILDIYSQIINSLVTHYKGVLISGLNIYFNAKVGT